MLVTNLVVDVDRHPCVGVSAQSGR
eukprot:SAG11_NODE_8566_length_994_cov_1.084351_1_plen_24_part_10